MSVHQVSMLNLWMGLPLEAAVAAPRLHHQFKPNKIDINVNKPFRISQAIQKGLEEKGHIFREISRNSVVQAVSYNPRERTVFGASDPRKGGKAWGL
jgi:gamma-glutamyltranspeptidase